VVAPGPPGAAGDPGSGPDLEILSKHILNATQLLLDAGDVESLKSLVKEKTDLLKKFASDPSCRALMVERVVRGDGDEEEEISWNLSTDVRYSNNKATGAIFIKKLAAIETDKPLPSQMRIITLSEDSPYETLHSYLSCAVSPFFKSYLRESTKTSDSRDLSGDKMAPSVEKKLVELEMGLLHLQQNVDIPEIQLMPHPSVQHIIRTCSEQGRRARVQDMGSKVEDSTYLNTLQNLVNRWIKEIQKVTRMERDPSVGTALQEVSFWLNLERALLNIQEMRDSSEVQLTLDILKHGKRFHATVSFDTDTGLKQALAKVNDYSPLMKDFPLDELFAATEVEKIRAAVHSIFSHLKKIRSCQEYPVQRALRLIEAISRDLLEQMNKVLSTRRLMHIQNEEFEKVQFQCFEVFSAWDEQYETLQGTLRDIAKKKREEPLKVSWRVNPAHKLLQTRIDQMRKFRRQHEQL
jgi:dynein heavy chain 1